MPKKMTNPTERTPADENNARGNGRQCVRANRTGEKRGGQNLDSRKGTPREESGENSTADKVRER